MEVTNTMVAAALLRKYLESDAGSDLLGEMVKLAADVDQLCDAAYGERTEDRATAAMATGIDAGTAGPERSPWRSPNCGRVRTYSPFSSPDAEANKPWTASCARPTWRESPPAGRWPGSLQGHRRDVPAPGVGDGRVLRRQGGRVQKPAPR